MPSAFCRQRVTGAALVAAGFVAGAVGADPWTIYVANDNCPDYTWGLTEEQTRQAFADVVRGHLDEMTRTDGQPPANRSRYNAAVTQEVLCFLEKYPDRREELIRRVKEGRLYVSPYLCNSLWAFQGFEGALRTFSPARRLEREWGIRFEYAHHIEEPSLPWGHATILAGCGFRGLTVPYYGYDSTFGGLRNPPVFFHEGPDGSRVAVVLDPWASSKASYTQGAAVLNHPETIAREWLPHYASLRTQGQYPAQAILASGTHGDIAPHSGGQARGFAQRLIDYNARPDRAAQLVNATVAQFWQSLANRQGQLPDLPVLRGCFGHSWDVWPVCLAKYAADLRAGERQMLAAETPLALAAHGQAELGPATAAARQRAEWCWAMLADHAWNGTDPRNQRHNADLRRAWSEELLQTAEQLQQQAWTALGLVPDPAQVVVFNSLSTPRAGLVRIPTPDAYTAIAAGGQPWPSQRVEEDGVPVLYAVSPVLPGFAWQCGQLQTVAADRPRDGMASPSRSRPATNAGANSRREDRSLSASPTGLESPYYRLAVDRRTGGIGSLTHKASGEELVVPGSRRSVCQTVYYDGREQLLEDIRTEMVACGAVLARIKIEGRTAGITVTNFVTVYAALDQVDFDVRLRLPVTTKEHRLCHVFPVVRDGATVRVATTGAVIRPRPQPDGDLLAGADQRRLAVQDFVSVATDRLAVTLVPVDAFVLRQDLDPLTFAAVGNDQNYREVVKDQHGVTQFRCRYSLQGQPRGYDGPSAFAFSRGVATPLVVARGRLAAAHSAPAIALDPARAVATCLKPADDPTTPGAILRLQEVAGRSGPLPVRVQGYRQAVRTDLLERDVQPLPIEAGQIQMDLRANGYAGLRLVP